MTLNDDDMVTQDIPYINSNSQHNNNNNNTTTTTQQQQIDSIGNGIGHGVFYWH